MTAVRVVGVGVVAAAAIAAVVSAWRELYDRGACGWSGSSSSCSYSSSSSSVGGVVLTAVGVVGVGVVVAAAIAAVVSAWRELYYRGACGWSGSGSSCSYSS